MVFSAFSLVEVGFVKLVESQVLLSASHSVLGLTYNWARNDYLGGQR